MHGQSTALKTAGLSDYISSAAEIIEEARAGRIFILVDDEDRENEGDLVIPAQFATPDAINFMAKHARGLICLALTKGRVEKLGLPLMAKANGSRHETAFTVSIEAREGVTTGISAADRARTIAVAINPELGREDIATPGHVFPLMARDGGTLVRAGHTEAAVDIARLAGLKIGFVTKRNSQVVAIRARDLKIDHVYQGQSHKMDAVEKILAAEQCTLDDLAYVGDDIIDLPVMRRVGLAIATANARPQVKAAEHYVTPLAGGFGAGRDAIDFILNERGVLESTIEEYLDPASTESRRVDIGQGNM